MPWRMNIRPHFEVGGMIEDIVWLSADHELTQNTLVGTPREYNSPFSR